LTERGVPFPLNRKGGEKKMKKSLTGLLIILVTAFFVSGCARTSASYLKGQQKDLSWWGKSGARPSPVKDASRGGEWWWPDKPSKGKENTAWGNRGYVYLNTSPEKPRGEIGAIKKGAKAGKEGVSAPIQARAEIELQEVFFKFDSATLTRAAKETLKKNAEFLKANPALKITLEGYASPEGPSTYNLRLSEKRANSVKDYPINKEGLSANRLTVKPCGEMTAETGSYWRFRKVRFVRFIISK